MGSCGSFSYPRRLAFDLANAFHSKRKKKIEREQRERRERQSWIYFIFFCGLNALDLLPDLRHFPDGNQSRAHLLQVGVMLLLSESSWSTFHLLPYPEEESVNEFITPRERDIERHDRFLKRYLHNSPLIGSASASCSLGFLGAFRKRRLFPFTILIFLSKD